jgi:hypothetical protein
MFEPGWRKRAAVWVAVGCAAATVAATPMHEPKAVKLLSTSRSAFRIVQGDHEVGKESFERRTYSNNTIVIQGSVALEPGPNLSVNEKIDLTLEEESYFPRSLQSTKTMTHGSESFDHKVSVEMFANVAVIESELRGAAGTRRVVVPTGLAVQGVGPLLYWYQTLFWYDRELGGRQRFQWLDPTTGTVDSGEIRLDREETLKVLGKKTKVSVFVAERPTLGEATLYVNAKGLIVKCEQNMSTFELVQQSDS